MHNFACVFQMRKPKQVALTCLLRDNAVSYMQDSGDTEVTKTPPSSTWCIQSGHKDIDINK